MKTPEEVATEAMTGLAYGAPVDPEYVKELIVHVIETDRAQREPVTRPTFNEGSFS